MKGFLLGTVVLVGLEVLLTSSYGINNLQNGTDLFSRGLKRLLAPDVAGIPNHVAKSGAQGAPVPAPSGSSSGVPMSSTQVMPNPYIAQV
jgi:hypothetical protein